MKFIVSSSLSVLALVGLATSPALAQEVGIGVSGEASAEEGLATDSSAEMAEPEPEPEPPPPPPAPVAVAVVESTPVEADDAVTDHASQVGNLAIGYLGFRQMTIANAGGTTSSPVSAPVIGVRMWLSQGVGIDLGVGFSASAAVQQDQAGDDSDSPGPTTAIIHAGLPLALGDSKHFVFQIVPELNAGFASNTIQGTGGAGDAVFRGMHFDIGARAGAEIHFGFIDIPQLSLQAGVGIALSYDAVSYEDDNGTGESASMSFGTGVGDNPWNIFAANVAALYYWDK